jgi:UDP-4-amino-4-deoxy-L-arabinose-oxoglutarate aminotransferase
LEKTEKIPFFRPPKLDYEELQYVESLLEVILDSGILTNGPFCRELEEMIREMYGAKHAITCSSGTVGLWIALKALKPKSVAMPAFTWKSLAEIVPEKVAWLDIDRETWLPIVNGERVDTFIINLTFGNVDDYSEVIPQESSVIYDACHSLGSRLLDIGNVTVFSLSATKPATSAEGGVIITDDDELARRMVELRDACGRMSEIHAVLGQVYLGKLGQSLSRRVEIWNFYRRRLPFTPQKIKVATSYSVYGMLLEPEQRAKLIERIKDKMEYRIYYEPLKSGLPNTDWVYSRILCIPSFPDVNENEVVRLCLGR